MSYSLQHMRDLLRELVVRDMKIRYKRSNLGILWSLANPVAQTLVFTFLFSTVLPLDIPNYTTFLFSGILGWTWFSTSLNLSAGSIVDNPELVRRPGLPVGILPVVTVTSNAIHFLLALPALFLMAILGGAHLGSSLAALPLLIVLQFLLTTGFALLIASSHVSFRDTQHLVGVITMLAFYLTPVFYTAEHVPQEFRYLYDFNPMAILLKAYRTVLIDGVWPEPRPLLSLLLFSVLVLWLGHTVFRRASLRFADQI